MTTIRPNKALEAKDVFKAGRMPLRVLRREPQEDFPAHQHAGFRELVLVLGGRGLHISGGKAAPLTAGDVFVVAGTREHRYERTHKLQLVNVVIGDPVSAWLDAELKSQPGYRALFTLEPAWRRQGNAHRFMRLDTAQTAALLPLLAHLEEETERGGEGYEAVARGLLLQLAATLARRWGQADSGAARTDAFASVARAVEHLESHFPEKEALTGAVRASRMSERSLRRHFSALMGCGPAQYLIKLRLQASMELLRGGRATVTEAALECGFSDASYFAKQFRRAEGRSPRQWRDGIRIR